MAPSRRRPRSGAAEAYHDAAETAEFLAVRAETHAEQLARMQQPAAAQAEREVGRAARALARIYRDRSDREPTVRVRLVGREWVPRRRWWRLWAWRLRRGR